MIDTLDSGLDLERAENGNFNELEQKVNYFKVENRFLVLWRIEWWIFGDTPSFRPLDPPGNPHV